MYEVKIDQIPSEIVEEEPLPNLKIFAEFMQKEEEEEEEELPLITPLPVMLLTPMQMVTHVEIEQKEAPSIGTIALLTHAVVNCKTQMKQQGVLEMKWELELPRLKDVEILIRHYDTAPDRFHVEIAVAPEMQEILQKSLPGLEAKLPTCQFTPISLIDKRKRKKVAQSKRVVYSPD